MNPWVVHFYFPIFGTLFIPIDSMNAIVSFKLGVNAYNLDEEPLSES